MESERFAGSVATDTPESLYRSEAAAGGDCLRNEPLLSLRGCQDGAYVADIAIPC